MTAHGGSSGNWTLDHEYKITDSAAMLIQGAHKQKELHASGMLAGAAGQPFTAPLLPGSLADDTVRAWPC